MRRFYEPLTENWALKLSALGLAFLLWTVVKADNRVVIEEVPVRVVNRDPDWVLAAEPTPPSVSVVFSGPVRELFRVAVEKPSIIVPVDNVADSTEIHILRNNFVQLYAGLNSTRIEEFRPNTVRLTFDRVATRVIPLAATITGVPIEGFEIAGPVRIEPQVVRASGAASRIEELDSIWLPPIDVSGRTATDTQLVAVDTTGLGAIVSPRQAQVIVPIRPVAADTAGDPGDTLPPTRPR